MVPERSSLIRHTELVQERIFRCYWALINKRRAIRPIGGLLEEPVPVLQDTSVLEMTMKPIMTDN
jgi:hypothetical protein